MDLRRLLKKEAIFAAQLDQKAFAGFSPTATAPCSCSTIRSPSNVFSSRNRANCRIKNRLDNRLVEDKVGRPLARGDKAIIARSAGLQSSR